MRRSVLYHDKGRGRKRQREGGREREMVRERGRKWKKEIRGEGRGRGRIIVEKRAGVEKSTKHGWVLSHELSVG